MYTGLKHAHLLIISLFLINFLVKTIMLLSNHPKFTEFRNKTKLVEIILGTLVLVSGITLLVYTEGYKLMWLNVKMLLVFAAIPLGIVGMKKSNKALALLSLSIFLYVFALAWTKSFTLSAVEETSSVQEQIVENGSLRTDGLVLVQVSECAQFHGGVTSVELSAEGCVAENRSTEQVLAIR